jgi:transposase
LVEGGLSRHAAADDFGISVASAVRWLQRWEECGSAAAKPHGGSRSPLEKYKVRILALLAEGADLTLDEMVAAMRKRRIPGSRSALHRFLERHKITHKKSLRAAEQERAGVARARRRWIREQGLFDPAHLVFIDETAVSTNMVRLHGRILRGIRLIGRVRNCGRAGEWDRQLRVKALAAPVSAGPAGEAFSRASNEHRAKPCELSHIAVSVLGA